MYHLDIIRDMYYIAEEAGHKKLRILYVCIMLHSTAVSIRAETNT